MLFGPYAMSKFALEAMGATLEIELKDFGVRVTTVNPGQYTTPIFHKLKDSLINIAENSSYYKEHFEKMREFDPSKIGKDVKIIGEELLGIVNNENPPKRFISGSEGERNRVYDVIIDRLRDLMINSSNKTLEQYLGDLESE